ncbi:TetR/AcrR family transcriptional regulator [[Pseudopropionibacterium] massiliense]|uniref:TetR/AcrR family transcriptional regulator n=1 Tax=[Pseudopropionibacterium] massiliense TaxID=2220000 RepID=UPI00102F99B8|nr:TetR/AcrR family transcriptional regulator [[Pseudopropionibacterium] massiliense]
MTRARPLPPAERRASLIAATRQLILDHGPEVTTRQVAEAAGVAEGTLFRVFPTRRDLIAATIADHLSPERLADIFDAVPPTATVDETTEVCLSTAADYVTTFGRFIPRPHQGGDQDETRFRIMELWEARVCDIANWMRGRLAPHEAELTIPVNDFTHLVITLAMGYAHGRSPDTSLTPATLARLALDGARRKDSL